MTTTFSFGTVPGLTGEEQRQLTELTEAYNYHQSRNATKDKYYEGHVTLQDVNLGIALPKGLNKLEVGCNWGQKAVDALASRSMFDGFVSNSGALDGLQKLVDDNRLIAAYAKACRDQLKYGCVFATLSADTDIGCRIRFHSPATASALWNGRHCRHRAALQRQQLGGAADVPPDGSSADGAADLERHQQQAFWPQPPEACHPFPYRRLCAHRGQRHHCAGV